MIDSSNNNERDTKVISKYLLSNAIMYMSMAPDQLEIVCLGIWKNDHTPTPLFSHLLGLPPTPPPFRNFLAYIAVLHPIIQLCQSCDLLGVWKFLITSPDILPKLIIEM